MRVTTNGKFWLWALVCGLVLSFFLVALAQETESPPPVEEETTAAEPVEAAAEEPAANEDAEEPVDGQEEVVEVDSEAAPEGSLASGGLELPKPTDVEVFDIPHDDGTAIGVLWDWDGSTEGCLVMIEAQISRDILKQFRLSDDQTEKLAEAKDSLKSSVSDILVELKRAEEAEAEVKDRLIEALANKKPEFYTINKEDWRAKNEVKKWQKRLDDAHDNFNRTYAGGVLRWNEKDRIYQYLMASLSTSEWMPTNISSGGANGFTGVEPAFPRKDSRPDLFWHNPEDGDKKLAVIESVQAINPSVLTGTYSSAKDEYGFSQPATVTVDFDTKGTYNLRMVVMKGDERRVYDLGGATAELSYFDGSKWNNFIFTIVFTVIILSGIMIARRNPNLFIRRIQGLEAVDEAIGRATEMGKPVLYLCGLDSLATLSTLAAVNILGRVARRIADYDSDLVVPCRDPVVMTVAQEVVREGYIDQGRPDAFREDKIFFVTDDQFSFTATTCAIMMREKPAANFFMGYYYAESLLLAETGASTGAIQIAGTDATHQLPFFITTCDYTLIGEELYAASAYMSREPMLLGSLKGQDVGKALMMIFIIVQTVLFLFSPEWNWLKVWVDAL